VEQNHSSDQPAFDYPALVEEQAAKMVSAVTKGPLTARVPGCPEWNLGELAVHLGQVHRWATEIVREGKPGGLDDGPPDPAASAGYLADGVGPLVVELRAADVSAPCWNFARQNETKGFWLRRQAIETASHRWDAESALHAAGGATPEPIDAALASDAIDEWAHLIVRRIVGRNKLDLSDFDGDVHLHCTDVAGEWTFEVVDGAFTVHVGHTKATAAVRAPASDLYLYLMNRVGVEQVERFGDTDLIDRWLTTLRF
jgi:uncharacterized protein (TIGR03083 family)